MLLLKKLELFQFKNYTAQKFIFQTPIVGFYGKNGVGKTNILEAIHYLCLTKGYFSKSDAICVQEGMPGFRLDAELVLKDTPEVLSCILRETGKKEFSRNGIYYTKFSKHIGHFPCVVIAPDDTILITGGGEVRRKYMDTILCQINAVYLKALMAYQKILKQKNALLKQITETKTPEADLLDVLDAQLIQNGTVIFELRKTFFEEFLPSVVKQFYNITASENELKITYQSDLLNENFATLLQQKRNVELQAGRSICGIHKDELEFNLGNQLFKYIASQGQKKAILFALKIEEMEILKTHKGFAPFLLLDDAFEKLDQEKMASIIHTIGSNPQGQIFITDTHKERLENHLKPMNQPYEIIHIR